MRRAKGEAKGVVRGHLLLLPVDTLEPGLHTSDTHAKRLGEGKRPVTRRTCRHRDQGQCSIFLSTLRRHVLPRLLHQVPGPGAWCGGRGGRGSGRRGQAPPTLAVRRLRGTGEVTVDMRHAFPAWTSLPSLFQGPTWASVNRGVLLCADCTSVHRSLGRHVSHVRSIRVGHWVPEQLTMVQSLYSCGANSIWEYSLLNPSVTHSSSSKGSSSSVRREQLKKPSASDPLHPVKGNFISAKYQQLAFVYRPAKDEPAVSESELSRQLHSSVRTPNLETSLRLISQGADPNYFHPEKNSTPLQVAAKAGQACQVELLLVHGADPGAVDKNGRTASDYARASGHPGLAARIFSSQFELSDRLSFFLCQRRPDHSSPEASHFLVPDMSDLLSGLAAPGGKSPEERRVAKRKLQGLSNSVFEELAMDVYDEVDRRETDEVWAKAASSSSSSSSSKAAIIPFLPVNPEYGTTRNQGRQKLARYFTACSKICFSIVD